MQLSEVMQQPPCPAPRAAPCSENGFTQTSCIPDKAAPNPPVLDEFPTRARGTCVPARGGGNWMGNSPVTLLPLHQVSISCPHARSALTPSSTRDCPGTAMLHSANVFTPAPVYPTYSVEHTCPLGSSLIPVRVPQGYSSGTKFPDSASLLILKILHTKPVPNLQ